MTDRVKGLVVALEDDIRVDDVRALTQAIRMMRWVADVKTNICNHDDWMNRVRIRQDLQTKLFEVLRES